MIERVELAAIDELKAVLRDFAPQPFAHLPRVTPEAREACWSEEITRPLADHSGALFLARRTEATEGFVLYLDSPWDTRVVGRRVGFLRYLVARKDSSNQSEVLSSLVTEALSYARRRGIACLTCKLQPTEFAAIHVLERHGFLLMDTLVEFLCDFRRSKQVAAGSAPRAPGLTTRRATADDLTEVLAVNEEAFSGFQGRYSADSQLPRGTDEKVYHEWVLSAFDGWADWILVAEVEGRIAGYGIWKMPAPSHDRYSIGLGHYSLAGVHPEFAGRGVYSALAQDGMAIARDLVPLVDGPVHISNFAVQRALQKLGWKVAAARHSFHKWITS